MPHHSLLSWLGLALGLAAGHARAQQPMPAARPVVVSPVVGLVIDQQEKATYGLFPYYSADNFLEARFEQSLTPDSTVQLRTSLRDGRTVLRAFTPTALAAVRVTIETRQQELARLPPVRPRKPLTRPVSFLKLDHHFRVVLHSSIVFDGDLIEQRRKQLEFLTADSLVTVERVAIAELKELRTHQDSRPTSRFAIGNGHRLFLAPTARPLRRNEGYVQVIDWCVVGASYGLTNTFSLGLIVSTIPTLPLRSQFLIFTPKISTQIADKWHVGGGIMYLRVPDFGPESTPFGVGVGYGVATYGSADDNVTVGAGYGLAGAGMPDAPVVQVGAQKRVGRYLSLVSENYVLANNDPGVLGLYGVKINRRRFSLGLGAVYALPFSGFEEAFATVIPLYYDFTYRFGKGSR